LATDSVEEALKKLGGAQDRVFGGQFGVDVDPLGVTLMERPTSTSADVTPTGTVKCTFNPADGCSPDIDG
jgi:hypothetical protein